jgi:hypothetical protein
MIILFNIYFFNIKYKMLGLFSSNKKKIKYDYLKKELKEKEKRLKQEKIVNKLKETIFDLKIKELIIREQELSRILNNNKNKDDLYKQPNINIHKYKL